MVEDTEARKQNENHETSTSNLDNPNLKQEPARRYKDVTETLCSNSP